MNWRVLSVAAVVLAVSASSAMTQAQVLNNNHYLCHKVKDLKVPAKFVAQSGVSVVDQTIATTVDLKKPYLLCNPVSKNGGPINDPALHYCCYKAKAAAKVKADYDITDQFGPLRLETKKPFLECNPCTKAPA
jgi:hypothetical protein